MEERELSQLEKEGIIQRFEYTWELVWKTLLDYLIHQGIVLPTKTPRSVLVAAFQADVIRDGDGWMAALDARNKMSHVYNLKVFEEVIEAIRTRFLTLFDQVYEDFLGRLADTDR